MSTQFEMRGQVGMVGEEPAPGVFEVEFSDEQGRAYAMQALSAGHVMVLHDEPLDRTS